MSNDRVVREASGGDPEAMQAMMVRAQRTQDTQALHYWLAQWFDQGLAIEIEVQGPQGRRMVTLRLDDGQGLAAVFDEPLGTSLSITSPIVQTCEWSEALAWALVCSFLRHALPPSHELQRAVDVLETYHQGTSESHKLHPQRWVEVVMRHELGILSGSQRALRWALHALRLALSGRTPSLILQALGHMGDHERRWQVSQLLTCFTQAERLLHAAT